MTTARNGDEVWRDPTASPPDLILVDLDHPDAPRLAVAGRRVVAFSSREGREGKVQADRLGLQGYIKVNVQTLAEDVQRYLAM
ncbi:MAG: hypothetical protein HY760_02065 [Nitrospirae bacterium]|nr:hypothetical protein [Nitrospirota bacterium]